MKPEHNNPPIIFRLNKAAKALRQNIAKTMESAFNVTLEEAVVLHALDHKEAFIQNDLATILEKDKSAILRLLDNLEYKQMVTRTADPGDRRRRTVALTPRGSLTLEHGTVLFDKTTEAVLEDISEADLETFLKVLAHITKKSKE